MRRWIALFIVFVVLFLPAKSLAQVNQSASLSSSQKEELCQSSKVHIQVKLKNGDTIKGDSLEINKQEVKLCREGIVQTIPSENIKEIKNRQTPGQRAKHVARVVGFSLAAIVLFGFIRYRSAVD